MTRTHFDASRREDGAEAVRDHLPITEADFDRILSGHQAMILKLHRYPPSLAICLVPACDVRVLPADYDVHEVPLLVGPEARQAAAP